MYTALASLFADRRVNKDLAMTGEINLRGAVLPIGGLKEKALGALQAGIRTILVPKLNLKDVPDIPSSARKKLKILSVETVDEVLKAALLKG
jgi:ATP-dependent Lon protease